MLYRELAIDERGAGRWVDVYLAARFSSYSRTRIVRHIRAGAVHRNGATTKASALLAVGDVLRIFIPGIAPRTPPPPLPPILREDEQLLALCKPSGMLVHPSGDEFVWGLIGLAKAARPQHRIDLVHRLDRETSGVLVMTKDRSANALLKEHFRERKVEKTYLAIVRGVPDWTRRDVQAPLGPALHSEIGLRRGVRPDGQHAHTTFQVLQALGGLALLSCALHTGRTHQIRAHLEHVGHPLLGDKIYGQPDQTFLRWLDGERGAAIRSQLRFPRHTLHAWTICFPHPDSGAPCLVEAPMPADMQAIIDGAAPEWPVSALQSKEEEP